MKNYSTLLLLMLLHILLPARGFSQLQDTGRTVIAPLKGSLGQLKADSVTEVTDADYYDIIITGTPALDSVHIHNLIVFKIDESSPLLLKAPFTAHLVYRLYFTDKTGAEDSTTTDLSLDLSFDTTSGKAYNASASFIFNGGYKVKVKIISISTNASGWDPLPALELDNIIQYRHFFTFNCTQNRVTGFATIQPNDAATPDELKVEWAPATGADEYDLEWTYVDSTAWANHKYGNPSDIENFTQRLFRNNATRVSLNAITQHYNIPLLYDNHGWLIFRVRAVQTNDNAAIRRIESVWSAYSTYEFTGHQRSLNWQSSTSFAEEGKRKSVVQYFDGSLKNRQTVTKDNTTNTTVVAESFYDHQGRPVIQVLPAPTINTLIGYTPDFNSINSAEYDKDHYDRPLLTAGDFCNSHADGFTNNSGASQYYSPNNPLKNIGPDKFIPDAKNYPFTEVQYLQDNTGRISKQSGVGPDHQVGSDHETKYFYGNPDQNELDALFGTEVGYASHYFKNMVRDANGQYSVSYIDMHGRTIATALAGDLPPGSSLDYLPSKVNSTMVKTLTDSTNNIVKGFTIESSKGLIVEKEGNNIFNYSLLPDSINLKDCNNQRICYDCLYDLEITITDDCNNQKLGGQPYVYTERNFSPGSIPNDCANPAQKFQVSFTKFLKEGAYTVTKKLTISKQAFDYYRDTVFASHNLCTTLDDFMQQQRDSFALFHPCEGACAACTAQLGDINGFRSNYLQQNGIAEIDITNEIEQRIHAAYNKLQAACDLLCGEPTNRIDEIREDMLYDLMPPSGQYADPEKTTDPLSIFYSGSSIPPYQYASVYYKDADGNDDYVTVDGVQKRPNDLTPAQFALYFKPSWAEALLDFHPEYKRLNALTNNVTRASYDWDYNFESVQSFAEARQKGYLNPTGNSANINRFSNISFPMPTVGDNGVAVNNYLRTNLDSYLLNASSANQPASLWGLASASAYCSNKVSQAEINACVNSNIATPFPDITTCTGSADMAWQMFRNMYLAKKGILITAYITSTVPVSPPAVTAFQNGAHRSHFEFDINQTIADSITGINTTATDAGTININKDVIKQKQQEQYQGNCEGYAKAFWWNQLAPCTTEKLKADSASIMQDLISVCVKGSDGAHPLGSNTILPGAGNPYKNFDEVIAHYVSKYNSTHTDQVKPGDCNGYLITYPTSKPSALTNQVVINKPDECTCSTINKLYQQYRYQHMDRSFSAFIKRTQGTDMSEDALTTLRNLCNGTEACAYLATPIVLPPALQCGQADICVTCTEVKQVYDSFAVRYPTVIPAYVDNDSTHSGNTLFSNYMNNKLGFGKMASEYLAFIDSCKARNQWPTDSTASDWAPCAPGAFPDTLRVTLRIGTLPSLYKARRSIFLQQGFYGPVISDAESYTAILDSAAAPCNLPAYAIECSSGSNSNNNGNGDTGAIAGPCPLASEFTMDKRGFHKTSMDCPTFDWDEYVVYNGGPVSHETTVYVTEIFTSASGAHNYTHAIKFNAGESEVLVGQYLFVSTGTPDCIKENHEFEISGQAPVCTGSSSTAFCISTQPNTGVAKPSSISCAALLGNWNSFTLTYPGYCNGQTIPIQTCTTQQATQNAGSPSTMPIQFEFLQPREGLGTQSYWTSYEDACAALNDPRDVVAIDDPARLPLYAVNYYNENELPVNGPQNTLYTDQYTNNNTIYVDGSVPANSIRYRLVHNQQTDNFYVVKYYTNAGGQVAIVRLPACSYTTCSTAPAYLNAEQLLKHYMDSAFTTTAMGYTAGDYINWLQNSCGYSNGNDSTTGCTPTRCDTLNNIYQNFPAWYANSGQGINCQTAFAAYFNQLKGTSYSYAQIQALYLQTCGSFMDACPLKDELRLCGRSQPVFPPFTLKDESPCADSSTYIITRGTELYEAYKKQMLGKFDSLYINKCLGAAKYEQFTVEQPVSEYHHTLYYYDQAGNLLKTVPPQGVHANYDANWLQSVRTARVNGTSVTPPHSMVTQYRYNSLNQAVAQNTPDANGSSFWYDRLGRLVVSQNAKQKNLNQYSYTLYDYLGRITEVGQTTSTNAMSDDISRSQDDLQQWVSNAAANKEQITTTVYDLPGKDVAGGKDITPFMPQPQNNTRNRVSFTSFTPGNNPASFSTATFYSYDVHGNVQSLLNDYGSSGIMANNGQEYKRIDYNYDLISGKVNKVSYQPGKKDAFYHIYNYDAENRITDVYTSCNNLLWEHDAGYSYYKHGPLARTELGHLKVQGVDYIYTLQGWLKAINPGSPATGGAGGNGQGCAEGTAVNDLSLGTRTNNNPDTYTARNSVSFEEGFENGTDDYFDAVVDNTTTACTVTQDNYNTTDGTGGTAHTPKDAYNIVLNYYQNDYSPVNTVSPSISIPGQLGAEFKPLYNGNISSMGVNIDKFQSLLVYNYKYDQLNRLVQMDAWKSSNENWAVLTKQLNYHEGISYDANGNILRYQRNGDNSAKQVMDNMTYAYDYFTASGTRKTYDPSQPVPSDAARLTNRLNSIDDAIADGDYPSDIDNQATNNYDYDEIGNLVKDVKEGINNINWTVYGKISSIDKASGVLTYTYDAAGNRISKTVGGKTDWYVRDATGNVMSIYTVGDNNVNSGHITQNEIDIYGSSRLGVINAQKDLTLNGSFLNLGNLGTGFTGVFAKGQKSYELTNHLGNVLVTVSDKRIGMDNGTYDADRNKTSNTLDGVIDMYVADVVSANDYYPFGMMMPGRQMSTSGYRYGFNGKERDKDITSEDYDYGMRMQDTRIGRFLSVDPLVSKYPSWSPYPFAMNSPISGVDLDGLEFYYATNGTFVGHVTTDANGKKLPDKIANAVYSCSGVSETEDANCKITTTYNDAVDLKINHKDFQQALSVVKQEGDSKDPDEYRIIACIFYNKANEDASKLVSTMRKESSVFRNGKPNKRYGVFDNSIQVLSSRAGLVQRLSGGPDLSNGAEQNDGNDFISWGLTHGPYDKDGNRTDKNDGSHAKFREYQTILVNKDIFDKFLTNLKAAHKSGKISYSDYGIKGIDLVEAVFLDKNNFDADGNFLFTTSAKSGGKLVATATAGETIYWKIEKIKK